MHTHTHTHAHTHTRTRAHTLQHTQVEKELSGIMGRLNNPKFVEKAAPAYLSEVQGQAADARDRLSGIEAKIQQVQQLQQAGASAA
jgi:valyl-tRNA synthetase